MKRLADRSVATQHRDDAAKWTQSERIAYAFP